MRMRFGVFRTVGFLVLALILAAPIAEAESTGQDDLDLAIQTKSSAHTPGQFDKVIDLDCAANSICVGTGPNKP